LYNPNSYHIPGPFIIRNCHRVSGQNGNNESGQDGNNGNEKKSQKEHHPGTK